MAPMLFMNARHLCGALVVLFAVGCFAKPRDPEPENDGSTGISFPHGSDGELFETGSAASGSAATTGIATGMTDESDAGTSSGATAIDLGTVVDPFDSVGVFGDDVRELDLVGTWTMPWDPAGVPDVSLAIAPDGGFTWRETTAGCGDVGGGSGVLWVEGNQLVLHVEVWDRAPPWDVVDVIGGPLTAPFRMRLGYVPMGGFLAFAAPSSLTETLAYAGLGYVRLDASSGAGGLWASESELWAVPAGQTQGVLVVRDRYDATLSSGPARLREGRTWWWPTGPDPDAGTSSAVPWSDDTPGNAAGAATVGGEPYAYDSTGLFAFAGDRSFKVGVSSDCP